MYARRCRRALRAGVSRGRRAWSVLAGLGAATLACSAAMGQPETFGEWNDPPGINGPNWDDVLYTEHAVHLSTGQILIWDHSLSIDPQLWDPDDGSFTPVAISLHEINCSGHAALADGSILVAGGGGETGCSTTNKTSIFSSVLFGNPWTPVGVLNYPRWYPTCTTLRDGKVLVMAGSDPACMDGCAVTTPEVYDPDPMEQSWRTLDLTAAQITRWYPHMFVVPDGNKVFFAGGLGQAECGDCLGDDYCDSFVLDVDAETWDWVDENQGGGGSAVIYQTDLGAFEVLRSGGGTGNNGTQIIDVTLFPSSWVDQLDMKRLRTRHNLVLLPDGTILAVGGRNTGGTVDEAELFDPNVPFPDWTLMKDSQYPHAIHSTAVLLADGTVLAAGGDDTPAGKAEVFSPAYLFVTGGDAVRPVIGFAPTVVLYDTSFTVILSGIAPGAGDIDKVSLLRLASVTHGFDQNQRYLPLEFEVTGPATLSVDAPDAGNEAPPGYYMLFLVTDDGVPSVAKYVRLYDPA